MDSIFVSMQLGVGLAEAVPDSWGEVVGCFGLLVVIEGCNQIATIAHHQSSAGVPKSVLGDPCPIACGEDVGDSERRALVPDQIRTVSTYEFLAFRVKFKLFQNIVSTKSYNLWMMCNSVWE